MSLNWATIIFLKKRHSITHRWVWLFFLCIGLTFLKSWADIIEYLPLSVALQLIYPLAFISIPILFFFYIHNSTSNNQDPPRWWYMLFLLPFVQFLLSGYIFFVYYPFAEMQLNFYLVMNFNSGSLFPLAQKIQSLTVILSYLCMFLVMFSSPYLITGIELDTDKDLRKEHELARNRLLLLLGISFALFVGSLIYQFEKENLYWLQWLMIPGLLWMGRLIYLIKLPEHTIVEAPIKNDCAHKISFHMERHAEELKAYFDAEKPWLNPDLKETDVAKHLAISTSYLSEILNIYHHTKFRDFINSYRVDEFMCLYKTDKKYNKNEHIAEKAGFNSYNTFNRAFKKKTGTTPHEYFEKKQLEP